MGVRRWAVEVLIIMGVAVPAGVAGQEGRPPVFVVADVGVGDAAFADAGSHHQAGLTTRLGVGLNLFASLQVSAHLGVHTAFLTMCDVGCDDPPQPSGPSAAVEVVHSRETPAGVDGQPFVGSEAGAALELLSADSPVGIRATGGVGWLWGKRLGYRWLGGEIRLGSSPRRLVVGFEGGTVSYPSTWVVRRYEQGKLVRETRHPETAREPIGAFRIGVEWDIRGQ